MKTKLFLITVSLLAIFSCNNINYYKGIDAYNEHHYTKANSYFSKINHGIVYNLFDIPKLIHETDSLINIQEDIYAREDSAFKAQEKERMNNPIEKLYHNHPDWDHRYCELIVNHQFIIGFTKEQIKLTIGKPNSLNRTVTKNRYEIIDTWIYKPVYKADGSYLGSCLTLNFENDTLISYTLEHVNEKI